MNRTSEYEFTVIVPLYNEEDNILRLEKTLSAYLRDSVCRTCILFVNDGSTDGSLEGIRAACGRQKDFYYISFARNCGLSAALKAGFDYVESPFTGYIDADLQTDPEDFNILLPYMKDYDMAIGVRVKRNDSGFKRFQSKFANSFRRMMTGDGATDTGCPLKVFRTAAAREFPMFKGMHRFFPALLLLQDGARYKEVPVSHRQRTAGVSKFTVWNRMMSSFADCFAYRWMRKRYIRYKVSDTNLKDAGRGGAGAAEVR